MGVGIGQVKDVLLPKEGLRAEIEVLLQVDKSVQKNITQDSIATIKWLSYVTGDSYVEISTGAYREKFVEDGDTIRSEEPLNYSTVIEGGINIIESFSKMLKKLEEGKVVESLNNVSSSLNEGVVAFQKGEGLLHSLIYDPKGKQLFENVLQTSESFKEIMAMVENEEGTLGALIADPALYDNVKRLLGGAERSFVLRSLIRKSLEKGKEERKEIH
jgi:phospholipid/cholesterol/gamma-HCH transport system substrate-binding protein